MLLKELSLYLILLFYVTSCKGQESKTIQQKINGLSFVASNRELAEKDTESVQQVNANWVALMPFGFMPSANSPTITFNSKRQWWGETAEGIKTTASLFEKQHIKRMLKPQIWIRGGSFTGFISMPNETDWIELEKNYEAFILFYAQLAQDLNIELFCIGTELGEFVKTPPVFWNQLIAKTRDIYSGKITYAANWDSYSAPTFWKELDYIGIDAYFPLSDSKSPSIEDLNKAWSATKSTLKNFSDTNQKSIIFTEYGYRSVDFSTRKPWDSEYNAAYNSTAQQNALHSIFETFWQEPWVAGGFLWKWFDNHPTSGGENHTGFTVQNKQAEKLVSQFYKDQTLTNE